MSQEADRSGQLLAGRYRLEARLGSGGMGDVYRATNELIGRAVAIKLLRLEHAANAGVVERFLREARAANLVRHPNVVDVLDVGQADDGVPFLVQELLLGEDLAAYVARKGGRLAPREVSEIVSPVLDALAEAHAKGVIHRDLKPENVFLAEQGGKRVPKLLDFGISQVRTGGVRTTQAGVVMGTPAYMPPEQIRGGRDTDARSDVWAVGVMLFELLSGRLPFEGSDPPAIFVAVATEDAPRLIDVAPRATPELSALVERCLKRDPAVRYSSAAEIARDLRALSLSDAPFTDAAPTRSTSPNAETALQGVPDLVVPPSAPLPSAPVSSPPSQRPSRDSLPPASDPGPRLSLALDAGPGSQAAAYAPPATPLEVLPPPRRYDAGVRVVPKEPSALGVIVAGFAVVMVTVLGLGILSAVGRSASGWHALELAGVRAAPEVTLGVQVALVLVSGLLGAAALRTGVRVAASEARSKTKSAAGLAALASVLFYAAIELGRALF